MSPPDIRISLLAAMRQRDYTQRRLAAELQRRRPRANGETGEGTESWRNTLGRYLTSNEEKRQRPDGSIARLLADILEVDPETFVTPPRGAPQLRRQLAEKDEQIRLLEAEAAELRRVVAELRDSISNG